MNPFDYVNAINDNNDIIRKSENPEQAEKGYAPWMTNKALSYHVDTIQWANVMNRYHNLDKLLQFDYLINTVRKKKRYGKWHKPENTADLELVMESFKVGPNTAKQYLRVLTPSQLTILRTRIIKGG